MKKSVMRFLGVILITLSGLAQLTGCSPEAPVDKKPSPVIKTVAIPACATLLPDCNPVPPPAAPVVPSPSAVPADSFQVVSRVEDYGAYPLPNSTRKLRVHVVRFTDRRHPHYVYSIEDAEGNPIAGTSSDESYKSGKYRKPLSITLQVNGIPADSQVTITCNTKEECARKLTAIKSIK